MNSTLHLGKCEDVLVGLPDASVQAILTDPPYRTTNLKFDRQPVNWAQLWPELRRVLAPTGVIVMFASDLFTVSLILSAADIYRYRMVWAKSRATGFYDASQRPLRGHEDLVVFIPHPRLATYNPQKHMAGHKTGKATRKRPEGESHWNAGVAEVNWEDDGTRHPTSVLTYPSICTTKVVHPTQKPLDLMKFLVASYTNPGDHVLDPFMGSGTTGVACGELGRRFTGIESNPEYHRLAKQRTGSIQVPLLSHG